MSAGFESFGELLQNLCLPLVGLEVFVLSEGEEHLRFVHVASGVGPISFREDFAVIEITALRGGEADGSETHRAVIAGEREPVCPDGDDGDGMFQRTDDGKAEVGGNRQSHCDIDNSIADQSPCQGAELVDLFVGEVCPQEVDEVVEHRCDAVEMRLEGITFCEELLMGEHEVEQRMLEHWSFHDFLGFSRGS